MDQHDERDLDAIVRALRAVPPAPRGLPRRVMAAVHAERARTGEAGPRAPGRPRRAQRGAEWAIAAALLLVAAGTLRLVPRRGAGGGVASSGAGTPRAVAFALRERSAHAVAIVGDFNRWDPRATPLRAGRDGTWRVELPLEPGRYAYAFLVDGERVVADPAAPRAADDDFGAPSSVVSVIGRLQ